MAISIITATNVNGIQDISSPQNVGAGYNATITDEVVLLRAVISTGNTTGTFVATNVAFKIGDLDNAISYGANADTVSTVALIDCYVEYNIQNIRRNLRLSKLLGTHIRGTKTGTSGLIFIYTQAGNKTVIDAKDGKPTVFDGIYVHEIVGAPLTYRNAVYKNCGINILNWEAGILPIRNISFGSGTTVGTNYTGADGNTYNTYDAWLGGGNNSNRLDFYDCVINLSKIAISKGAVAGDELCLKYFSRSEKYLVGTAPISGLTIRFKPTASTGNSFQSQFFVSTNASGLTSTAKIDLLVENTVDSGTTRTSGLADPVNVRNYTIKKITWNREARGYLFQTLSGDVTPTSQVGNTDAETNVYLFTDDYVTFSQIAAAALTGISVNKTTKTITISSAKTIDQFYDFCKSFFVLQANFDWVAFFTAVGTELNMNDWSIVGGEFLIAGTKLKSIKTTGTVTASGALSNLSIVGNVVQTTPANLTNVSISGTLTYNTNTATTIALSSSSIGTVVNNGTGIVTITRDSQSTIDIYTDSQINYLDSKILVNGISSATIYPSLTDRNAGTNAGPTFMVNLDFKFGSTINGVLMQDTLYMRVLIGSVTLFEQITITKGDNSLDLGIQGQLSSINAKVELTAKESSLDIVNKGVQKASKFKPHKTDI